MRFEFRLRSVAGIAAWGEPPHLQLHWFGLTDGWFWIQAEQTELFRYGPAILAHWKAESPEADFSLPYTDYQIARYWADLSGLFPYILEPLPDDLCARVADGAAWKNWCDKADKWQREKNDKRAWDTYYMALLWWSDRQWDAGHLNYSPRLHLWTQNETTHLRWENDAIQAEGIPVWASGDGEIDLPVSDFVDAVMDFDRRFLAAMENRIRDIETAWLRPDVAVRVDELWEAQNQNAKYPLKPIAAQTDWRAVRDALAVLDAALP